MTVEDHVLKLEIFLMLILVDECSFKLSLFPEVELLHLYLLGEIHAVLRHSLEYGLLRAPVDGELLVPLLLLQIVDLVLRKRLFLNCGEIPVESLDVDTEVILVMDDDSYILLCMGDADVGHAVLEVRLTVVMMIQVHLLLEYLVEQSSYSQLLTSLARAAEKHDLFHFISRNGAQILELIFRLCNLPYGDFCLVVEFPS